MMPKFDVSMQMPMNMGEINRWLWSVMALLIVSGAHAQWNVQISVGAGFSRMNTDLSPVTSRGEYQVVDQRPSWSLGANASHPVTKHLSFRTGLHWSAFAGHDEYWLRGNLFQEGDRKVNYLYLPLIANFELHRLHVGVGYQFGLFVNGSGTFSTFYEWLGSEDRTYSTDELGLKKTDIGVVAEAGYRITDRFDLGLRYYYGMQDIKDHGDGIQSPLSNEQFVITVGYGILPKVKSKQSEEVKPTPADQPVE